MARAIIKSVSRAVPEHKIEQVAVVDAARALFGTHEEFHRLLPVFTNSQIETRYLAMPLPWFFAEHGWKERMQAYQEQSLRLLTEVAEKALAEAGLRPEQIDAIVTVSTTGVANPSLESYLLDRMPFSPWVRRTPIWGWGCAGGLLGLARASELARNARVLLLSVELCSLSFRKEGVEPKDLVSAALFGDGAAAVILEPGEEGWAVEHFAEYRWPDSASVMGWDVEEDGFSVLFSRQIPYLVAEEFPKVLAAFRQKNDIQKVDHYLAHPGGAKIISALESVYGLESGSLKESWDVLRRFGNMSSPSILYVLDEFLKSPGAAERALVTTFGPGFTCGLATLTRENS